MNGTWRNWATHAGIAALIVIGFTLMGLPSVAGALIATAWFWGREAGEFGAKHWNAAGRPWADLNPFHPLRRADDKADLLSAVGAAWLVAVVIG